MDDRLRVAICDDDPAFRNLVARVLRDTAEVVGSAGTSSEALAVVREREPDVLLLDVDLGTESAIDVLPQLLVAAPRTMVAALTGLDAVAWEDDVLVAGAFVYYEKTSALELPELLATDVAAFRRALEGEDVLAPSALRRRSSADGPASSRTSSR